MGEENGSAKVCTELNTSHVVSSGCQHLEFKDGISRVPAAREESRCPFTNLLLTVLGSPGPFSPPDNAAATLSDDP